MQIQQAVLFLLWPALAPAFQPIQLSPEARQTAALIGVSEAIDDLAVLASEPTSTEKTVRELVLRQKITEALLDASLDVDAAAASISREEAQIRSATDVLSARRDRRVGLATAASTLVGGGVGIVGSAMQFSDSTAIAGDAVSVGSGAGSTVLSLLGMRLQRGGEIRLGLAPNMLARVLDRPSEAISAWPGDVWKYLNMAPAATAHGPTRLERLKADWTTQGKLGSDRKIAFLTSGLSDGRRLSLNDLSDRSSMLADLRSQLGLMKRDLAELVHALRQAGW